MSKDRCPAEIQQSCSPANAGQAWCRTYRAMNPSYLICEVEARDGIEPSNRALQTLPCSFWVPRHLSQRWHSDNSEAGVTRNPGLERSIRDNSRFASLIMSNVDPSIWYSSGNRRLLDLTSGRATRIFQRVFYGKSTSSTSRGSGRTRKSACASANSTVPSRPRM